MNTFTITQNGPPFMITIAGEPWAGSKVFTHLPSEDTARAY